MSTNKQALREASEKALSARARLALAESVFTDDGDIIPEAQTDINTCTQFNDMSNPATVLGLLDELEAAEARIAELEAREVKLPQHYSMLHRDDFSEQYHTEMVYRLHQVLEALHEAGISVKWDSE